ncbi:hypothetical protein GCM10027447_14340 [Glycomyces halotolerans]
MSHRTTPSPVKTEGRYRWGRTSVAGRTVRAWADLRHARVVIQLDIPEPRDVGVVVTIGEDFARPVLLVNPQQQSWAGTPGARPRLLEFAVEHYRDVEASVSTSGAGPSPH